MMIARAVVVALLPSLCACGIFDFVPPKVAPAPSDREIVDAAKLARNLDAGMDPRLDPKEFALEGFLRVDRQCNQFFDQLVAWRNATSFAKTGIAAAGAATAGVLALTAASTVTMGVVGLVAGLAVTTVENFEQFAVATAYPIETRELVFAAMRHSVSEKNPRLVIDMHDARSTVAAYAQYCTYGGIATLAAQALRNGAGQMTNQSQSPLTAIEKAAASIRAGGTASLGLTTDAQYAMIVVLGDTLTEAQRDQALAAANFTENQKKRLLDDKKMLTQVGKEARNALLLITATNAGFRALVERQRATITGTPPAAGATPQAPGSPSPVNALPVPNPAVKIGQ